MSALENDAELHYLLFLTTVECKTESLRLSVVFIFCQVRENCRTVVVKMQLTNAK